MCITAQEKHLLTSCLLLLLLLPSVCRYFPTGGYLNSKQGDGSGWVSTKDWLDMLHGRKARPSKNGNNNNNNTNNNKSNNNNNNNNGRTSQEKSNRPAPARPATPAPAPAPAAAPAPARNSFFPFFFFGRR
jgi:hypothetical protein